MRRLVLLLLAMCVAVAAPANATTVLWVGGTAGSLGRLVPPGMFGTNNDLLGGAFKNDPIVTIDYPGSIWPVTGPFDPTLGSSVSTGVAKLETAATTTPGPLVIVGTSQGAMVVQQAEADLNGNPAVPSDTTFIVIADPNIGVGRGLYGVRIPVLGYTPAPLPQTRFHTVVVINQYDGFTDPIRRPWNLLTDLNAAMGIVYVHSLAHNADLSTVPAEDITTTENAQHGTTTVYHVPTEHLPLTMPLRQLGIPARIVDGIDSALRPVIDRGYLPLPSKLRPAHRSAAAAERHHDTLKKPTAPRPRSRGSRASTV